MAQSDSKTQFLLSPPVAPFKLRSTLKFLRFLLGFGVQNPSEPTRSEAQIKSEVLPIDISITT